MNEFHQLLGEWTATGKMPGDDGVEVRGSSTIERLGEFFVLKSTVERKEFPDSISVIGGGEEGEPAPVHYFDSRGVKRLFLTAIEGSTWRMWRAPGEDWNGPDGPGFNQRYIGEISADGNSITGAWERGLGEAGDEWEVDFKLDYER